MANENIIKLDILLDNEVLDIAYLKKDMKLNEVREYINSQNFEEISNNNFLFLKDNSPLKKRLENKLALEEIINNNKLFLSLQENISNQNKTLPNNISLKGEPEIPSDKNSLQKETLPNNIPIKGAIEITSNKNVLKKYYQYPNIEFTSEEEDQSKVVLLVGKTGDGKTTFINALVNVCLGIQFEDNFRYLLVNQQNVDQQKSVTKNINIYKIRPKEGLNFPFIKIIDTPGFGDTEGIDEDMKHIKCFQKLFEDQLMTINCICFIVKAADSRVDPHQEYILNCIMDLFAENIRDNFMVGVTNKSDDYEPNIISNALSRENNFYYINILKKENVKREDILNSNWYFASNNITIINHEPKINKKSKLIYEDECENIIKFINKIKSLEGVNIKESANIVKNREELKNEIEGLATKMERIISSQRRLEENQQQSKNILDDIKQQEKVISALKPLIDEKKKNIENIQQMECSLEDESKRNNTLYQIMIGSIEELNKQCKNRKKEIKISYELIETNDYNVICTHKGCNNNCHTKCSCNLTSFFDYFCSQITFLGNCKICGHGLSDHQRIKKLYEEHEQEEEVPEFMNFFQNQLNEIDKNINIIKKREKKIEEQRLKLKGQQNLTKMELEQLNKEQKGEEYIKCIIDVITNLKKEEKLINDKIGKIIKEKQNNEMEIIKILHAVKSNLDYLRKNALNKESNNTMEKFIDERIKISKSKDREILEHLKTIYRQLIALENIDISMLTYEKYLEIKKNIEEEKNVVF